MDLNNPNNSPGQTAFAENMYKTVVISYGEGPETPYLTGDDLSIKIGPRSPWWRDEVFWIKTGLLLLSVMSFAVSYFCYRL